MALFLIPQHTLPNTAASGCFGMQPELCCPLFFSLNAIDKYLLNIFPILLWIIWPFSRSNRQIPFLGFLSFSNVLKNFWFLHPSFHFSHQSYIFPSSSYKIRIYPLSLSAICFMFCISDFTSCLSKLPLTLFLCTTSMLFFLDCRFFTFRNSYLISSDLSFNSNSPDLAQSYFSALQNYPS